MNASNSGDGDLGMCYYAPIRLAALLHNYELIHPARRNQRPT